MVTIGDLIKMKENSPAQVYWERLFLIKYNYYFLERNYDEFSKIIDKLEDREYFIRLWNIDDTEEIDRFAKEITRTFINFISMAMALKDSTRHLITEWYLDTDFFKEYDRQVQALFTNNAAIQFVEDLRNYVFHYQLPVVLIRPEMETKNELLIIDLSILLRKSDLLKWNKWAKGKEYLQKQSHDLDIYTILSEYYQTVLVFYNWLETSIKSYHSDAFRWLEKIEEQIKQMKNSEPKE